MQNSTLPTIGTFKKEAKKLKKENGIKSFGEALSILAKKYGYKNWFTIKPKLPQDREPLILTTIYMTIYKKDTLMSESPYVEICGSREEQEDKILLMINNEYKKSFESFEEAWIFHLKRTLRGEEDWIETDNKEYAVRPHGNPDPIYPEWGEVWEEDGKKYHMVIIQDALQSEYYGEYYETSREAEERAREIEDLNTAEWGLIKRKGIKSQYSHEFNVSPTTVIKAFIRPDSTENGGYLTGEEILSKTLFEGRDLGFYAIAPNSRWYIFLPQDTKDINKSAMYALGEKFDPGELDNFQIELYDVHGNGKIYNGKEIPKDNTYDSKAEVVKA